jgi:hypothetical protein
MELSLRLTRLAATAFAAMTLIAASAAGGPVLPVFANEKPAQRPAQEIAIETLVIQHEGTATGQSGPAPLQGQMIQGVKLQGTSLQDGVIRPTAAWTLRLAAPMK